MHLEKAKGADSGMSAHIERTIVPKNIDPTRTHLNRELIRFPDGVCNRTATIRHRLDTAGLKRKIGKNQVQAIRIVLSGTHEDMERMENERRLGEWCDDSVAWLRETYGADNLVSAVLHMDEETPHIHATVVPIVQGERRKQKKEEKAKRRYRTKATAPRLCADEVMSRANLIRYQDTYTEHMAKYELKRGVRARQPSTSPRMSITAISSRRARTYRRTSPTCWQGRRKHGASSRRRSKPKWNSHASRRRKKRWN